MPGNLLEHRHNWLQYFYGPSRYSRTLPGIPHKSTDHRRVNADLTCNASASHSYHSHCTQVNHIISAPPRSAKSLKSRKSGSLSRVVPSLARETFTCNSPSPSIATHLHTATRCAPSRQSAKRRRRTASTPLRQHRIWCDHPRLPRNSARPIAHDFEPFLTKATSHFRSRRSRPPASESVGLRIRTPSPTLTTSDSRCNMR